MPLPVPLGPHVHNVSKILYSSLERLDSLLLDGNHPVLGPAACCQLVASGQSPMSLLHLQMTAVTDDDTALWKYVVQSLLVVNCHYLVSLDKSCQKTHILALNVNDVIESVHL